MEKILGASWRTTLAGIGVILGGISGAIAEWRTGGLAAVNWTVLWAALVGGIGLIKAKDAGITNAPQPGPALPVPPPAP